VAEELEALKAENERLKQEAEAGKKAVETLTAQEAERKAGIRADLEKVLGDDGVKELYGEEGIPEDRTVCQLSQDLKLANHGVTPAPPSGEAEEVTTGTGNQFKTMPQKKPKPKGEGEKVKDLTELAKYQPPNPRSSLEEDQGEE